MKRMLVPALIALVLMVSCINPGLPDPGLPTTDPPEQSPYAENVVLVTENISQSITWLTAKVYYLDRGITVENGATLTIPAGSIVKFGTDGTLSTQAGGTIKAVGTADLPIIFTSIRDSAAGEDSLLTDSETEPAAGDWQYVWIADGSNSNDFTYCEFRYGGKFDDAVLWLEGVGKIDHCTFRDNLAGLPWSDGNAAALDARYAASGSSITNNVFYNNTWPLSIKATMNLGDTNTFSFDHDDNPATPDLTNTRQGIYLFVDGITGVNSWTETQVPFCIFDSITVYEGATLTIAEDVVCKFSGSSAEININETASVTASGYTFTSWRDDSLLGDTNGDGTDSTPADGDWVGVYDYNVEDYRQRDNTGTIRYSEFTSES